MSKLKKFKTVQGFPITSKTKDGFVEMAKTVFPKRYSCCWKKPQTTQKTSKNTAFKKTCLIKMDKVNQVQVSSKTLVHQKGDEPSQNEHVSSLKIVHYQAGQESTPLWGFPRRRLDKQQKVTIKNKRNLLLYLWRNSCSSFGSKVRHIQQAL